MKHADSNDTQTLTNEQVQQIIKLYSTGEWSHQRLAEKFGVTKYQIKKALKGVQKWKPTVEERFWSKVKKGNPDECWEWQGTKDRYGYGRFFLNGKMEKAHRLAYQFTEGSIPEDHVIRHKVCGNRDCCNPNHLKPGTVEENRLDMLEDGSNWRKLSYAKVLEAKFLEDIGWSDMKIAEYLSVKSRTINKRLRQLQDIETQQTFSDRAKRIMDKEAKNNPPIQIVINRVIE